MEDYYSAIYKCAERYRDMIEDRAVWDGWVIWSKLHVFTHELMFGCRDKLPLMKLSRWLGYIQGVLIERGVTSVEKERDWTRPLFRPLDFPTDNQTGS